MNAPAPAPEIFEDIQRYPLAWPLGWKRVRHRRNGMFKTAGVWIGVPAALDRLQSELDRLGARAPVLSSNLRVRINGTVVANEGEPTDPGVAAYFAFRGRATVLACDTYFRVADNIAALAAHIEALRRIERYGVGTIEQALAGYKALPADTAADWRKVLGFGADARVSVDELTSRYRSLAREASRRRRQRDRNGASDAGA